MKNKLVVMVIVLAISLFTFTNAASADYYSDHVTLYKGMRNSEVINLQKDLKMLGYFNYYPTGYFGGITLNAVKAYQGDNGLQADGIVGPRTAREIKVDKVMKMAKQYQGVPYVWGGVSPSGFDCSGFTHYVLLKNNIIVPRTASAQYNVGTWIQRSQLKPGDMVFFATYQSGPSHVGFYLGNNKFIHASSGAGRVTISDLTNSYYSQRYIGAKRVI